MDHHSDDSDTDSESTSSLVEDAPILFQPPTPRPPLDVSTRLPSLAEEMLDAIDFVNELDCDHIEDNLERIHQASTHLLDSLDTMISTPRECLASEAFCRALCTLVQIRSLDRLLRLREIFHTFARQEPGNHGSSSPVICWVDVVLSRCGEAVLALAGSRTPAATPVSVPLRALAEHKERVSLYAALQLPQRWSDIVDMIASDYASPAAIRLAIRIAYAVYVLPLNLRGLAEHNSHSWPSEGPGRAAILCSLRAFLHKVDARNEDEHFAGDGEFATYAMVASLYATASYTGPDEQPSPFRPHSSAILLKFIRRIMSDSSGNVNVKEGVACSVLSAAQSILLEWGLTLPWAWYVWSDERLLDYDVVEYMTMVWLSHLGKHPCTWDAVSSDWQLQVSITLAYGLIPSCYIVTILFLRITTAFRVAPNSPPMGGFDIIERCSFAAARLIKWFNAYEEPFGEKLCQAVLDLLVYMPETATTVKARANLLAGLSSARPDHLRTALESSTKDISFRLKLGDNLSNAARRVNSQLPALHDDPLVRQSLQFLTVIGHSGAGDPVFQQSGCALLRAVSSYILRQEVTSSTPSILLDPLVSASAVLSPTVDASRLCEVSLICEMIARDTLPSVPTISALACFLLATIDGDHYSAIDLITTWVVFCDFVALVQRRYYIGHTGPLSLLVCPAVLRALETILQHCTSAVQEYLRSSPWTLALCENLYELAHEEGESEYDQAVQLHLSSRCCKLLERIEGILDPGPDGHQTERTSESSKNWQLLGCTIESTFCLLLV